MDTSNDYLFALQLQNEFSDDIEDRNADCVDLITSSSKYSNPTDVIDLTEHETDVKKRKRSDFNETSKPIKQSYQQNVNVVENIVDPSLDTLDPNPDIHSLFLMFDRQYFWSTLGSVVVQWSKRMTVCAGLCKYESGFCSISLSEPLLKLRPRSDLVETLLHEMIHAYLFLTKDRDHNDRDGHGPEFCKHMYRINMSAGTKISIYHNFHDEVRLYQQHWWKCDGPCQHSYPFYGIVRRSINRAPGPNDKWWAHHSVICNGNFIKINEPEGYKSKKKSNPPQVPKKLVKSVNKITNFFEVKDSPKKNVLEDSNKVISKPVENKQVQQNNVDETTSCPICNDHVFTDWLNIHLQSCDQLKKIFGNNNLEDQCQCPACDKTIERTLMNEHLDNCKMISNVFENNFESIPDDSNYINCPTCDNLVLENNINAHLDVCLSADSSTSHNMKNQIKCPCCDNTFKSVEELDDHIDACLL